MQRWIVLLLSSLFLVACSSSEPILNAPIKEGIAGKGALTESSESGENRLDKQGQIVPTTISDDLTLILTFSGGGTRAAAFSYGVLKGLRDTEVQDSESSYRLLDKVDLISSVSGGSFTAAYYGLYGDQTFEDYESRFLKQPVQTNLIVDWLFNPSNWFKLFPGFYNRSDLAADFYEEHIFGAKTFTDFPDDAPRVVINATDLSAGTAFSFTPDDFQWICSDLGSYPIGRAVAASAAVPILFSPIPLRNHSGCKPEDLVDSSTEFSRNDEQALGIRKYQDKERYPFLHLVDGGISDNLGVRSLLHVISENNNDFWHVLSRFGMEETRDVVFVVVNASDIIPPDIALTPEEPDTSLTLASMTTIQFNRYNLDTLDMLESEFETWAKQVKAGRCQETQVKDCSQIRFHLVELNFSQLPENEFQELGRIETSLELPPEQVDKLIRAGEKLLKSSPQLQQLVRGLESR